MSGIQAGCAMGFDVSTTVLDYFNSTAINQGGGSGSGVSIGSGGRNSTNAFIATISGNHNSASAIASKTLPVALTTIYQTFPFIVNKLPIAGNSFIVLALRDTGTAQIDVRLRSDGKFIITRNGAPIGNASTFI